MKSSDVFNACWVWIVCIVTTSLLLQVSYTRYLTVLSTTPSVTQAVNKQTKQTLTNNNQSDIELQLKLTTI